VENVIIKFTADTTGLQPAVEQLKLIGKITEEDARKIDEINQSQAKYLNTLKATTKEAGNFGDEMASIKAEIQAGILEGVAEHFAEMGKEMEKTGKKTKTLKQELRELKQQIASGGLDAKQLSEATKRAAELEDHLGDVQQKIKALSSDTKRIDGVVEGFRALAAGVAITQGAIGLLGGENEKVEKTLLKVQSAMALLTGVQEIAKLVTDENILKTTYLSVAQRLAGKSATIMGVEISAAMAAATAGISLIIAGIAYLVVEMSSTEDSAKKIQERLGKMYEKDADVYANVLKKRQQLLQGSKEGELKALKIGYDQEFRERLRAQKETGQSQKSFDAETRVNLELYNKQRDEINKKWDEKEKKDLKDQQEKKAKVKASADAEALKKAEEEARKRAEAEAKATEEANKRAMEDVDATSQLKKNYYKQLDIQKEYQKSSLEIDEIYSRIASEGRYQTSEEIYAQVEKELKDYKDLKKKQTDIDTKYLEEKAKKEEEYRQLAQQTAIQILENTASFAFSQIEQNLQQETDLKVAAAEEEQRKQLEGRELSASQQQAIERNTQREIARIKTEAARKQRQADVVQASINGAIAITKAYATMDPISASIAAVGIATLTALQIASIKNQPIPKFAKGTKGVEGPGTDTSDSILAYLSKGEMVIPTKTKESYFPALDLIFDKKVSPSIANELLLEASKGNYNISHDYNSPVYVNSSVAIDYDKLDRLFSKNKSTTNINMDESGFRKFLITENGKNEYLNKKFRK
jgi:myosin heavy subunit